MINYIWISPDWNVNSGAADAVADDDIIWISPDWNVNATNCRLLLVLFSDLNITRLECKFNGKS